MQHTEELEAECKKFCSQITSFKKNIGDVVKTLAVNADKIEKDKLRAIGQRNKVDSEVEDRQRQRISLQGQINEKRGELERYDVQLNSLQKVQADQLVMIEKLQNQ